MVMGMRGDYDGGGDQDLLIRSVRGYGEPVAATRWWQRGYSSKGGTHDSEHDKVFKVNHKNDSNDKGQDNKIKTGDE